jgi:hypothetical protein
MTSTAMTQHASVTSDAPQSLGAVSAVISSPSASIQHESRGLSAHSGETEAASSEPGLQLTCQDSYVASSSDKNTTQAASDEKVVADS